jgi:hypothetical protein
MSSVKKDKSASKQNQDQVGNVIENDIEQARPTTAA